MPLGAQSLSDTGRNPFNSDPAGPFFAGREAQINRFRQRLAGITSQPQHMCVVGRQGEGKTSFLQKTAAEARERQFIACECTIDPSRSAEENIGTIVESLLEAIDSNTDLKLREDWKRGKNSGFRTPLQDRIRIDDLLADFQSFLSQLRSANRPSGCVLCVDDGQGIHPFALSALRNVLQKVGAGYMLIMALRNDSIDVSNAVEGPRIIQDFATISADTGLPRLFENNFISLGPFDTPGEAEDCIRKRLDKCPIRFSDGAIPLIGKVTGRYPRNMMLLANEIYTLVEGVNPPLAEADNAHLRQAFINTYKNLVEVATEFCAQETNTKKNVYRATLQYDGTFTPLDIAMAMLGAATSSLNPHDFATDPVTIALERLVGAKFCTRSGNDQYQWSDPLRAHALRIAVS